MKFFKLTAIFTLLLIVQNSFAQVATYNDTASKDPNIAQKTLSIIGASPIQRNSNADVYSKKEWKKIQKEIKKSKKRVTSKKDLIHSSKVIDTIFLMPPPVYKNDSRLTEAY